MISTTDLEPGSNANFNTNVPSVSSLVTTNDSATVREYLPAPVLHPQLQECTFNPVTPIKYQILDRLLRDHPNRSKVDYVVQGFHFGFSLKYNGPLENRQPKNLLLAYQHTDKLWVSIRKEVHLGHMLEPFPVQPIDPLICSPVGMVPKRDSQEMWHITHLSHLRDQSINTFINQEDAQTHYQTFEAAVELVARAGPGSYMVKEDFKSAFCNVPMCFADLNLLGIKVKGQFFIETCLPFSTSISCATFEDISTLIHWIAERRVSHALVHYLDDFFMVHHLPYVCGRIMLSFKEVCNKIGMPISPEKAVGPVQVIQFLGLTIDTIGMVIKVPEDKRVDILTILTKIIQKRRATSLSLQSLAGRLNFLCKAVPASRPFIKNVYQGFTGVPQHQHIDLKGDILADLRMWKAFLLQFRGWQPIICNQQRAKGVVELYADASGNPTLDWGAFLPSKGLLMFKQ